MGISLKPAGHCHEVELAPAEIREILEPLEPAKPVLPLAGVMGYERPERVLEAFTFEPGRCS